MGEVEKMGVDDNFTWHILSISVIGGLIDQFNDQLLIEFDQWIDGRGEKGKTFWLASWTDE